MTNNMNGSQKFLQAYKYKWESLDAVKDRNVTLQDLPSDQEVREVFEECMRTRELPGNQFSISNLNHVWSVISLQLIDKKFIWPWLTRSLGTDNRTWMSVVVSVVSLTQPQQQALLSIEIPLDLGR
jgi:hypothetical protein